MGGRRGQGEGGAEWARRREVLAPPSRLASSERMIGGGPCPWSSGCAPRCGLGGRGVGRGRGRLMGRGRVLRGARGIVGGGRVALGVQGM